MDARVGRMDVAGCAGGERETGFTAEEWGCRSLGVAWRVCWATGGVLDSSVVSGSSVVSLTSHVSLAPH